MASVELEGLTKRFETGRSRRKAGEKESENGPGGGFAGVDSVSLAVGDGEYCVLVGPSGCGKTTTLRLIAGLERADSGRIRIDGRGVDDISPRDRNVAMVFQDHALYPWMTAAKNMGFGLKMRGASRTEIRRRVGEVAELLDVVSLLDRRPGSLSGGERQRVALGRAIARSPAVFLFDEPLSNLDARLRLDVRGLLKRLHRDLGMTVIHVTHDQEEAMALADRLAVMAGGRVQQVGSAGEVYSRPANCFVGGFVGSPPMSFAAAETVEGDSGLVMRTEWGDMPVPKSVLGAEVSNRGSRYVVGVRPEAVVALDDVAAVEDSAPGRGGTAGLRMRIESVEPLGWFQTVSLRPVGGGGKGSGGEGSGGGGSEDGSESAGSDVGLTARLSADIRVEEGATVMVKLDVDRLHWFSADAEGARLVMSGHGAGGFGEIGSGRMATRAN